MTPNQDDTTYVAMPESTAEPTSSVALDDTVTLPVVPAGRVRTVVAEHVEAVRPNMVWWKRASGRPASI